MFSTILSYLGISIKQILRKRLVWVLKGGMGRNNYKIKEGRNSKTGKININVYHWDLWYKVRSIGFC